MKPDDNLLTGINLDQFSEADQQKIQEKLYRQLENRVGAKVESIVSDEQFTQFESVVDQGDENKLDEWLEKNLPNYEQIVGEILQQLKQEVTANPQSFLEADKQT